MAFDNADYNNNLEQIFKTRKKLKYRLAKNQSLQKLVQRIRATLHQLHQREVAAILQPSHVRSWARRVQEGGYRLGLHGFRYGSPGLHWAHGEGTFPNQAIGRGFSTIYCRRGGLSLSRIIRYRQFVIPKSSWKLSVKSNGDGWRAYWRWWIV